MTDSPSAPPAPAAGSRTPSDAWPRDRRADPRRARDPVPRRQPALELRQARGARQGQLPQHVRGADRRTTRSATRSRWRWWTRSTRTSTSPASSRISCRRTCKASPGRSRASRAMRPNAGHARCSLGRAVQQLFVGSPRRRRQSSSQVLENKTEALDTTNGNVVLDIRPLVLSSATASSSSTTSSSASRRTPGRSRCSSPTSSRPHRTITQWLKAVADWIWVLVILCWAAAVWLVPRPRRREVRAIGDRRSSSPASLAARDPLDRRQLHRRQGRRHRVGQARRRAACGRSSPTASPRRPGTRSRSA